MFPFIISLKETLFLNKKNEIKEGERDTTLAPTIGIEDLIFQPFYSTLAPCSAKLV